MKLGDNERSILEVREVGRPYQDVLSSPELKVILLVYMDCNCNTATHVLNKEFPQA